jgi:hypothetical protein
MTQGVETWLEGSTLVVRIPMRFQRRGGRKRIVAPDGGEIVPVSKPQPDGTLLKALARAWRWQRLPDQFWQEARGTLPLLDAQNGEQGLDDLFIAVDLQRMRLRNDQQLSEWNDARPTQWRAHH